MEQYLRKSTHLRRCLALVLTFSLVIAGCCISAEYSYAAAAGASYSSSIDDGIDEKPGADLKWSYADGTYFYETKITISGTGNMYNFSATDRNQLPWRGADIIESVTIAEGVTSVGNNAFSDEFFPEINSINLPNSLITIGDNAFSASSFEWLGFSENTKKIGHKAFNGTDLERLTLPESLTSIADDAFNGVDVNTCKVYVRKGSYADKWAKAKGFKNIIRYLPKSTSVKSVKSAKKALTVKWGKVTEKIEKKRITGYYIQVSTSPYFTDKTTKKYYVKGYNKTSKKITGLKAKTKYYVRIQTYNTIKNTKYWGKWSAVKTGKTK